MDELKYIKELTKDMNEAELTRLGLQIYRELATTVPMMQLDHSSKLRSEKELEYIHLLIDKKRKGKT